MENVLQNLNKEQRQAVTHGEGPLLIVAGAGTGKTTVVTKRVAWLILNQGVKPDEVLALTFTDKAASEMEERVDRLLPYGYVDLWISTFHAFCDRILKQHALDIGLPADYKLLNQTEQWLLARKNLDRFDLDYYRPLGNPTKFIHALLKHFSRAKDEMVGPEEYLDYVNEIKLNSDTAFNVHSSSSVRKTEISPSLRSKSETNSKSQIPDTKYEMQDTKRLEEVANAYHVYQQLLLENSALDFGDLINYTLKLFQTRPRILEQYRQQFKYILIDEFQDTNYAQYELIKLLASPKDNLTVVGDDDQAIYRFRGASMSNILQFKKDYPKAREIFITNNYRNFQNILDLSYAFIKLNDPNRLEWQLKMQNAKCKIKSTPHQPSLHGGEGEARRISSVAKMREISKKLKAQREGQGIIEHLHAATAQDEGRMVLEKIFELHKKNKDASWNDYAVLVRANDYAEPFIKVFAAAGAPYQFIASRGLYSKPIVLDILAYLKLLDNYHEGTAMWRVLNFPIWQIKNRDLASLNYWSSRKSWSLYETMRQARVLNVFLPEILEKYDKILGFIEKHTSLARQQSLPRVIFAFFEDTGYLKNLTKKENSAEILNFLNQFYRKVQSFEESAPESSVKTFLEMIELELQAGDAGALEVDIEAGPEAIKILTAHSAKGLEWPYVFITNLVDRRFPTIERAEPIELPNALIKEIVPEGDIHLEEERRLFYVAMTRARDGVFFTSADDYGGARKKKLSRFLHEIGIAPVKGHSPIRANRRMELSESPVAPRHSAASVVALPPKFSYTQLKAFENCPLQYKFAHLLRIPVKGRPTFSFGQTIHRTLAQFYHLIKERSSAEQKNLFDGKLATRPLTKLEVGLLTVSLDDLLKLYDQCWIDDWYPSKADKEKFRKKGSEALKAFYQANAENFKPPLYIEQPFNLKIGDVILKGVIDRVDEAPAGVEIVDYKTGSAKTENNVDKDQLIIYQIASEEVFKKKPAKLTYYFIESGEKLSFLSSESEKDKIKEKITGMVEEIKKSDFPATPSEYKCKFCDFKDICEFRAF